MLAGFKTPAMRRESDRLPVLGSRAPLSSNSGVWLATRGAPAFRAKQGSQPRHRSPRPSAKRGPAGVVWQRASPRSRRSR
jgi:hypothetical protein